MQLNDVVNTALLAEPYNWVFVILVLIGAVMLLTLIAEPMAQIGGMAHAL